MGGTLFMGRTCSAFTAGVMAIGLRTGEIENSRLRVIRLLAIMTVGGDAFDDRLNKFNPSMNRGYRLSKWFANEFGSTQCQKITGCDFSDSKGVSDYVDGDGITSAGRSDVGSPSRSRCCSVRAHETPKRVGPPRHRGTLEQSSRLPPTPARGG